MKGSAWTGLVLLLVFSDFGEGADLTVVDLGMARRNSVV